MDIDTNIWTSPLAPCTPELFCASAHNYVRSQRRMKHYLRLGPILAVLLKSETKIEPDLRLEAL